MKLDEDMHPWWIKNVKFGQERLGGETGLVVSKLSGPERSV